LMTWIFFWPAPARTTLNSVFSSAAGDGSCRGWVASGRTSWWPAPATTPAPRAASAGRTRRRFRGEPAFVRRRPRPPVRARQLRRHGGRVRGPCAVECRAPTRYGHRQRYRNGCRCRPSPRGRTASPPDKNGRAAARSILIWAHTGHVPGALPDARRASRVPCRLPPAPVVGSPLVYATAAVHIRMVPSGE